MISRVRLACRYLGRELPYNHYEIILEISRDAAKLARSLSDRSIRDHFQLSLARCDVSMERSANLASSFSTDL